MSHVRKLASMLAAAAILAAIWTADTASSEPYPARPITLVVPYPAGGATDAIARIIGDSMSHSLGQRIVIENLGGAGGMIGATRVARSMPDGHTLLLHQLGLAAGMTLYSKAFFDAEKDLTGVGLVSNSAAIIAGRSTLPPNNMAELVRWMKQPGHRAKIAHAGGGAFGHLCSELFAQEIGAPADQVPYRGGGPALKELIAGRADLSCLSVAAAAPLAKSGKLKAYGIVGQKRFVGLPDVPTMAEAGYRNLGLDFWHALFAPAGTARPVIDKINAALRQALNDAKVKDFFAKNGMELYPADQGTPEVATAMLKSEIKRCGDVIRANKITAH